MGPCVVSAVKFGAVSLIRGIIWLVVSVAAKVVIRSLLVNSNRRAELDEIQNQKQNPPESIGWVGKGRNSLVPYPHDREHMRQQQHMSARVEWQTIQLG